MYKKTTHCNDHSNPINPPMYLISKKDPINPHTKKNLFIRIWCKQNPIASKKKKLSHAACIKGWFMKQVWCARHIVWLFLCYSSAKWAHNGYKAQDASCNAHATVFFYICFLLHSSLNALPIACIFFSSSSLRVFVFSMCPFFLFPTLCIRNHA